MANNVLLPELQANFLVELPANALHSLQFGGPFATLGQHHHNIHCSTFSLYVGWFFLLILALPGEGLAVGQGLGASHHPSHWGLEVQSPHCLAQTVVRLNEGTAIFFASAVLQTFLATLRQPQKRLHIGANVQHIFAGNVEVQCEEMLGHLAGDFTAIPYSFRPVPPSNGFANCPVTVTTKVAQRAPKLLEGRSLLFNVLQRNKLYSQNH